MPQTVEVMPLRDMLVLRNKARELEAQGKTEEAASLNRQVPLPAFLAKFAKDHLGTDFVHSLNWSMAEAEAEYGSDWLAH